MENKEVVAFEVAMCKFKENTDKIEFHNYDGSFCYRDEKGLVIGYLHHTIQEEKSGWFKLRYLYYVTGRIVVDDIAYFFEFKEYTPERISRVKELITEIKAKKDEKAIELLKKHLCS